MSAKNAMTFMVVNHDLLAVIVKQRKMKQFYGTTKVTVRMVEYSIWIVSDYRAGGYVVPMTNFG